MASKAKRQGLGKPESAGLDNLFGGEEVEQTPSESTADMEDSENQPGVGSQSDEKVKTSISITQQTLYLLYDLKNAARKQEGRLVSQSELIERAIRDLAEKMNVPVES